MQAQSPCSSSWRLMLSLAFGVIAALAPTSHAQPSGEAIKLGLNYPATGRYQQEGIAQAQGALMAIAEINASNGILGRPVELLTANSASDPVRAVDNVNSLAQQGAAMLFGGASSAVAVAASKAAAQRDLLYFGTLTYANETTGADGHRHMFRETYNAHMAAKALARYLNEAEADKTYFYLTADYNWGWSTESSLRTFTNTADTSRHQGALVTFPRPRESDMQAALEQARASKADVLVLIQFGDDMAMALTVARRMGLHETMTIVVPNLTLNMAKKAGSGIMEGVIGAAPWVWQVPYRYGFTRGQQFVEAYVARYGHYPSSSAASAYSIVYQFKAAAERAQSLDTSKLIAALEGHRYTLLKDEQEWRAFDHQNVQSVYVIRSRPRLDILQTHLHEDYFDILLQLPANEATPTRVEWEAQRRSANQPLSLQ